VHSAKGSPVSASRSWLLVCAVHGVASMLLWWARADMVDVMTWHAEDWQRQPWTLWTSAWVHMNTPHLIGNQLALGVLTAFAWMLRPNWRCTLAWLLAWPLTQVTMAWWPQVGYAVGLSGPLHAGAMLLAVQLVLKRIAVRKGTRWGGLLMLGLLVKLAVERGWSYPVVWDAGNDMSVVQAAHLSGACWGLLLGWLLCGRPWPLRPAAPSAAAG
jgi:membrane associated rhomboid family serine protease